jgi:molybdopterin/thiamine biosynthesis adenylyltransferase
VAQVSAEEQVMRHLVAHGFSYFKRRRGVLWFRGELSCRQGAIKIELGISDWDFVSYPTIRLLERPASLEGVQAHLTARNGLCYYTHGAVVLNRFDPVVAVAQCVAQATEVLDSLALDPEYRRDELTREYLAQWSVGQLPAPWVVIKAGLSEESTNSNVAVLGKGYFIFGDKPDELAAIAEAVGESLRDYGNGFAWVFRTPKWPPMSESFPTDLQSLFTWLKAWDKDLSGDFQHRLGHDRGYLKWPFLYLMIKSPAGWLGIEIPLGNALARKVGHRKPSAYRQQMHSSGKGRCIVRLAVVDWSAEFIHSRNLDFDDLTNKRITLIGCGAIGSHLAEALVRLGAGQGKRGHLRIIDPDSMSSENLGRHALGYPSLLKDKPSAMKEELHRTFPLAKVDGIWGNALAMRDLFKGDLLIDATGEEAVSEAINAQHMAQRKSACPVLYVRISGTGGAVQSFWVDADKGACFHCLRYTDAQGRRVERFPIEKSNSPTWIMKGCHALTPYAVSAPMHAAALATDAIADWLRDQVSPRLRVLVRPGADVHPVKSQDPKRLDTCSACGSSSNSNKAG